MNKVERIKAVKAMEFLARQINDESIFDTWLSIGVADDDIKYGDLDASESDFDALEYYIEDACFADLMDTFLHMMHEANMSGGLYCDGVVSKAG